MAEGSFWTFSANTKQRLAFHAGSGCVVMCESFTSGIRAATAVCVELVSRGFTEEQDQSPWPVIAIFGDILLNTAFMALRVSFANNEAHRMMGISPLAWILINVAVLFVLSLVAI